MNYRLALLTGIAIALLTVSVPVWAADSLPAESPSTPISSLDSGYGYSSGPGAPESKDGRGTKLKFQGGDHIEGSKQTDYSTITLKAENDHTGNKHLYKERINFNVDNQQLLRDLNFGL